MTDHSNEWAEQRMAAIPPAPLPEEPPEEFLDAVNNYERAICLMRDNQNADEGEEDEPYDSAIDRYDAKRAALLALFDRQREANLELWSPRSLVAKLEAEVASLSSQLARQQAENERVRGFLDDAYALTERLKAEQLTAEEAAIVNVDHEEDCYHKMVTRDAECECGADAIRAKLRRLSQSGDTGAQP